MDEFKPVLMKPITPEIEADIVRRYTAVGQNINMIRFALDISPARIRQVLRRNNVAIKKAGPGKGFIYFGRRRPACRRAA